MHSPRVRFLEPVVPAVQPLSRLRLHDSPRLLLDRWRLYRCPLVSSLAFTSIYASCLLTSAAIDHVRSETKNASPTDCWQPNNPSGASIRQCDAANVGGTSLSSLKRNRPSSQTLSVLPLSIRSQPLPLWSVVWISLQLLQAMLWPVFWAVLRLV